jgi:tetratricopeptide (TPR) repeat protein
MRHTICGGVLALLGLGTLACGPTGQSERSAASEVPITTRSDEARAAFLRGRELFENLRATDARSHYLRAVEIDSEFALAHLALANTAPTANEFWESLGDAVRAADRASDGERDLILAADAAAKGDVDAQERHLQRVVAAYPDDARAHNALGAYYFGTQDWSRAAEHYEKAIALRPDSPQPYNQLGYAHRFLAQYERAEEVFRKYIELIPDEPNPYDSYAELLMKLGRYDESIRNYREALARDPNFVASYVGIGNNQVFLGRYDEARQTLAELEKVARTDAERRTALFWTASSYLHQRDTAEALRTLERRMRIAEDHNDLPTLAGDLVLIGNVLLESGQPAEAEARYRSALEANARADVPEDTRENFRRNQLYREARVLLARGALDAAAARASEYGARVAERGIPFEIRLHHELLGRVALARGEYAASLEQLRQANDQDPLVLLLTAQAHEKLGDASEAREAFERAANFNGLNFNYAYVRSAAQERG